MAFARGAFRFFAVRALSTNVALPLIQCSTLALQALIRHRFSRVALEWRSHLAWCCIAIPRNSKCNHFFYGLSDLVGHRSNGSFSGVSWPIPITDPDRADFQMQWKPNTIRVRTGFEFNQRPHVVSGMHSDSFPICFLEKFIHNEELGEIKEATSYIDRTVGVRQRRKGP